jgi:glycosyltransferase involved in cell wall biosynthesis
MAKSEELWVITRSNNQEAIESSFPRELAHRVHFVYCDLPRWQRRLKRKEKGLYLYYALWQWHAYKLAKKLAKDVDFDCCLHLTFGSMWMPTWMHRLPIPFIWGPIGGGECVPFGLVSALPWRGRIPQYVRYALIRLAPLNPLFMGPARAARAIVVRTEDSGSVFPESIQAKIRVMLETGMSEAQLLQYQDLGRTPRTTVNFIYTGRLVAIKNVEMAINAFALACSASNHLHLTIVGEGPSKQDLMTLAKRRGVFDRIRFTGAISQHEVIAELQQSDIFVFPSLKEGGTWSLMEAMAVGLPVICIDTTGMHVITDGNCASRIPPTDTEKMTFEMAEAMIRLAVSAPLRHQMGDLGRRRLKTEFLWSHKGQFMAELLDELAIRNGREQSK